MPDSTATAKFYALPLSVQKRAEELASPTASRMEVLLAIGTALITAPDGWTLVPIEPTLEMIKAGESWSGLPSATWADMLDAAPAPSMDESNEKEAR